MSIFKNKLFVILFAFLMLLVDGHLSLLSRILFQNQFIVSCHFLFIVLLFYTLVFNPYFIFGLACVLGIIYDFYYLGVYNLGIATMLYPLTIVIMFKLWKHIPNGPVQRFLVFFILIFFLDFASIGMAYLYQLTAYPLNDFITYNLAPSLIFNILAFLFFQKLLERIYL